jgi:peptidoglycan hydrolase-like protein with peptidoglycan-binding domain
MKKFFARILAGAALVAVATGSASAQAHNSLQLAQAKSAEAGSIEKLDMSAVPDLDRATVRRVQGALRAKGFDPGPANGVTGDKTKAAVQEFQERFGIKADGVIDNQTLFALGVVGTAAPETEKKPEKVKASRPEHKQKRRKSRQPSRASQPRKIQRSTGSSRTRWCAYYINGSRNCGFYSFQQCLTAVRGVGGTCSEQ